MNDWKVIAIAAGVGLALGYALGARGQFRQYLPAFLTGAQQATGGGPRADAPTGATEGP